VEAHTYVNFGNVLFCIFIEPRLILHRTSGLGIPLHIKVARWFTFKPKIPIWVNFGGLENVDIFYGLWEYFMAIWNIIRTFGILYGHLGYFLPFCTFCVHLVHFFGLGDMYQEKSGNPATYISRRKAMALSYLK
jgi:hypothetical protein